MTNKQSYWISIPIVLIVVALDQLTKFLFTDKFYVIIPNIASVFYNENTGAAWSIFQGKVYILAVLSIAFLIALVIFNYHFKEKTKLYMISYGLVVSGAVGNLIDRVLLGYVRDFVQLNFINFPIFNIADAALTIGMICLSVFLLFVYPKVENKSLDKKDKKWTLK